MTNDSNFGNVTFVKCIVPGISICDFFPFVRNPFVFSQLDTTQPLLAYNEELNLTGIHSSRMRTARFGGRP